MSYILDALRRADAERQQGQLPGLHAQLDARALPTPPSARGPLGWTAAAMGGAMLVAAAWWWLQPAPPQPTALPAEPAAVAPAPAEMSAPAAAPLPIVVSAPPPAAVAVPPVSPPPPPAVDAPAAPKPLPLSQLAADLRRQLPPLVVGGSVWSDSAASRFIILDGLMLREGDTVAPGLVLERIQQRAALLRWRDRVLEVPL